MFLCAGVVHVHIKESTEISEEVAKEGVCKMK